MKTYRTFIAAVQILAVLAAIGLSPEKTLAGSDNQHAKVQKVGHFSKISHKTMEQQKKVCDPTSFIGAIDAEQETVYSNCEGKTLYGRIDAKGHGTLVDEEGAIINVTPH